MKYLPIILKYLWGVAVLIILYQFSQNGRYQIKSGEGLPLITDTRTGNVFIYRFQESTPNYWESLPALPAPSKPIPPQE